MYFIVVITSSPPGQQRPPQGWKRSAGKQKKIFYCKVSLKRIFRGNQSLNIFGESLFI